MTPSTFDRNAFEHIATLFGYMSDECIESVERAERDIRAGRVREASLAINDLVGR